MIFSTGEVPSEYLTDESRLVGAAQEFSLPETEKDVCRIIESVKKKGISLTVQGARTGIRGAAVPVGGHVMCMQKMNHITDLRIASDAAYITMEAGCTLTDIQNFLENGDCSRIRGENVLERAKQNRKLLSDMVFLPAPTETSATFGGMFSVNASGPNAKEEKKTSDYVEHIRFLTVDGEIWDINRGEFLFSEAGCMLPNGKMIPAVSQNRTPACHMMQQKNRMDLIDYLSGTEGMLGILLELTVKTVVKKGEPWGILAFFEKEEDAICFLRKWRPDPEVVQAIEWYDDASMQLVSKEKDNLSELKQIPEFPIDTEAAVYCILQHWDKEKVESSLVDMLSVLEECGVGEERSWAVTGKTEVKKLNILRHAIPELVNMQIDRNRRNYPQAVKRSVDASVSNTEFGKVVSMYRKDLAAKDCRGVVFGHVQKSHLHVNLLPENEYEDARAEQMVKRWEEKILDWGGCIFEENGIGKVKRKSIELLSDRETEAIKTAKKIFDPNGVLNPGNVFGQ